MNPQLQEILHQITISIEAKFKELEKRIEELEKIEKARMK